MANDWITVKEATQRLGVSQALIYVLMKQGCVRTRVQGRGPGSRFVLAADVEAELQRRRARALRTVLELGVSE